TFNCVTATRRYTHPESGNLILTLSSILKTPQKDAFGHYSLLYSTLIRSMILVLKNSPTVPPEQLHIFSSSLISQTFYFISSQLEKPIVIHEIADYLHISESLLYKTFIKYYNEAPKKVLTSFKLRLSIVPLQTTTKSLDEIALEFGFNSSSQYSKTFKNILGCSPRKKVDIM
ncbi:MAG: helix-turn-helix transcriptional regulator, partial [Lachnospiraceae bacterium]